MDLAYTPEQERLRQQLRAYFTGLMTPEVRAALTAPEGEYGNGEAYRQVVRQLGRDGWLALSLAAGVRGPRRVPARPAHLHRRGGHRRGARAVPDDQHGGPDDHALRHPGAEGGLPAPDRRRRDPLLDRLLRAGGGHRSGRAAHPGGPGRRRLRHQRPEDVDQPDPYADYVWLACRTDPEAPRHKGLSILIVPTAAAGLLLDAGAHDRRDHHQRHLLLRRPGARLRPGRRREPGLAADHQPAQPRAGRPDLGGPGPVGAARGDATGPAPPSWPAASASSTPNGCS